MRILLFILLITSSQVLSANMNYVAQVTSKNVDGSERTRLYLTNKNNCQRHLKLIINQSESTVGVTKTYGAKCGNASYLIGFFQGIDMGVPYILSSKGRDVIILNGASHRACLGIANIIRTNGVNDAVCIN